MALKDVAAKSKTPRALPPQKREAKKQNRKTDPKLYYYLLFSTKVIISENSDGQGWLTTWQDLEPQKKQAFLWAHL